MTNPATTNWGDAFARYQHLYDAADMRDDTDRKERLNEAWDAAVDECERRHDDGSYTDEQVAAVALEALAKDGIR